LTDGNRDSNSAVVALEWQEFEESIAIDASDKVWWDYRALFRTKNHRWRFAMVMFMSVFGQFSGGGLGYFNTVIYNSLGYTEWVSLTLRRFYTFLTFSSRCLFALLCHPGPSQTKSLIGSDQTARQRSWA
jgi:hypothetical protein